jgi:tRNA nucleotidyltransferase (CCA-adding enzyme)
MQEAIKVMNSSKAPDESRAKVAAAALKASYNFHTTNRTMNMLLVIMRKNAIDDLRKYGIPDDSVYPYLERTYAAAFNNVNTDYDEILKTLSTLATSKSDEAAAILYKFLRELNERRRTGPWDRKERQVFEWVINSLQLTGTQSPDVRALLTTIQRNDRYTSQERRMAQNALNAISAAGSR